MSSGIRFIISTKYLEMPPNFCRVNIWWSKSTFIRFFGLNLRWIVSGIVSGGNVMPFREGKVTENYLTLHNNIICLYRK